jgi:hypothetical protein
MMHAPVRKEITHIWTNKKPALSVWMAGWVSSLNPSKHKSPDGVVRKLLLALLVDGEWRHTWHCATPDRAGLTVSCADGTRLRMSCQIDVKLNAIDAWLPALPFGIY